MPGPWAAGLCRWHQASEPRISVAPTRGPEAGSLVLSWSRGLLVFLAVGSHPATQGPVSQGSPRSPSLAFFLSPPEHHLEKLTAVRPLSPVSLQPFPLLPFLLSTRRFGVLSR